MSVNKHELARLEMMALTAGNLIMANLLCEEEVEGYMEMLDRCGDVELVEVYGGSRALYKASLGNMVMGCQN